MEEKTIEKEFIVPLRREWLKVQHYRRAGRAAKAIKKFIARHMKVPERDLEKVKLDIYLNAELWSRGVSNPPARIKVKAKKDGEIVKVELAEIPEAIKFRKIKNERMHAEAKKEAKLEVKPEEKKEEKTEEEKKEKIEEKKIEVEKEKAVESQKVKESKIEEKAEKHTTKVKETQFVRRSMDRH